MLSAQSIVDLRYGSVPARIASGTGLGVNVLSIGLDLPVYRVSSISAWPVSLFTLLMIASLEKFMNQAVSRRPDAGWQHKSLIL